MIWSNNASWSKYFQAIVEIILIFEPFEKYKNFLLSFDFFSAPMKSGLPLHSVGKTLIYIIFYFNGFTSKFQQLYSQWQESKDSNIKPVTVKEV